MSYTPTLSPVPHPVPHSVPHSVVLYKNRNTMSFTHLPRPSALASPTTGLGKSKVSSYDFPFGFLLIILCFLYILARVNKKKVQNPDTDYTGIQMHQMYTLDPVRRRYPTGRF